MYWAACQQVEKIKEYADLLRKRDEININGIKAGVEYCHDRLTWVWRAGNEEGDTNTEEAAQYIAAAALVIHTIL